MLRIDINMINSYIIYKAYLNIICNKSYINDVKEIMFTFNPKKSVNVKNGQMNLITSLFLLLIL